MINVDPLRGQLVVDSIIDHHSGNYENIATAKIGAKGLMVSNLVTKDAGSDRDIEGVATTDATDAEDEVVLPSGADLSYIMATKALYADHCYGLGQVIGTIRYINKMAGGNGWSFRARMFDGLRNPLAEDTFQMIRQGGKLGVSIGFEALDWGTPTDAEAKAYPKAKSIVRKWKWIELSVTAMPCNVNCYATVATDAGSKSYRESVKHYVLSNKISGDSAYRLGLPEFSRSKVMRLGGVSEPAKLMRLG